MASIIELSSVARRVPDADQSERFADGHSADVILFPGVRYERWDDPEREDHGGLDHSAPVQRNRMIFES